MKSTEFKAMMIELGNIYIKLNEIYDVYKKVEKKYGVDAYIGLSGTIDSLERSIKEQFKTQANNEAFESLLKECREKPKKKRKRNRREHGQSSNDEIIKFLLGFKGQE